MDAQILPERRARSGDGAPGAPEPRRGIRCTFGEGSLIVSFDQDDDVWRRFPEGTTGILPAELCAEVRADLELLAASPLTAFVHPTLTGADVFALLIDDEIVSFVAHRGDFRDGRLARWRTAVGLALR